MDIVVSREQLLEGIKQMEWQVLDLWLLETERTGIKGGLSSYRIRFDRIFDEHRKLCDLIDGCEPAGMFAETGGHC